MAGVLAACRESAAPAARATTAVGAPRVVVLSPALADTMRDLGMGDVIVGRHGFDAWTNPAVPVCGDQAGIDYEALLRAGPTHVLLQTAGVPPRLMDLARERGWRVENLEVLSLEQVRSAARWLAENVPADAGARARALASPALVAMDEAGGGGWGRRPGIDPERIGRVLLMIPGRRAGGLGPGSFHHQVLESLGGRPALETGAPYIELDAEAVERLSPGAIILLAPRRPGTASRAGLLDAAALEELLGPSARLRVPAMTRGRVLLIDDPKCLLPSTALLGVAQEMARALERWSAEGPG